MLISIASGKGGTGKTAVALLLADAHSHSTIIDCDVEEPNCHLFLKPASQEPEQEVSILIPRINSDLCIGCGACGKVCLFNAIAIADGAAMLFDELCHSCGGCLLACPTGAISETKKSIGRIATGISTTLPDVRLISGTLHIGIPSAVPLIKSIKSAAISLSGDILLDCPPGTACAMVHSVKGSNYCILVTEPTPLALHDLALAMDITSLLQIPTGVVINKSDAAGDEIIEALCQRRRIPVLAKIPHSLSFARRYAAGEIPDEFRDLAAQIWRRLKGERSREI